MTNLRFNANIGRARLARSQSIGPTANNTRNARAAMQQIVKNYQRLVNHIEGVTPQVLYEALEPTFEKSLEYCPVDTGRMKGSGYLRIVQFRGTPKVEIGYGLGGEPEYTAAVHENMEWHHKSPTRAKWLQVALDEDANEIQDRIVVRLRSVFR